ncbi:protein of unknown function [Caballeronia sp. S22]
MLFSARIAVRPSCKPTNRTKSQSNQFMAEAHVAASHAHVKIAKTGACTCANPIPFHAR